ncbi:MAG: hypothetical protein INR73_25815 [Williamsia sp.]|nr:hypothetical protein [Williamsia sp.]
MKRLIQACFLLAAATLFTGCQEKFTDHPRALMAVGLIVLISALFLALAVYSNILRDEVSDCDAFDQNAQKLQQKQKYKLVDKSYPFSLSKVQFGLWTVLISSCYIYLSLCKGDCAETTINKTALVLMGIFAGTAAASTLIDKKEISDNRPRHQNAPSEGFFIDILSDDNGISLHRFQSLVWTLIAMVVYIYKVSGVQAGCLLPELSDTLLALTGISSATYLVLRTKENDPPIEAAQQDTANAPAADASPSSTTATDPVITPQPA